VHVVVVVTKHREVVGSVVDDDGLLPRRDQQRRRVHLRRVHHVRFALGGFDLNQPNPRHADVEGLTIGDVVVEPEVRVERLGVQGDRLARGADLVEERRESGVGGDVCVGKGTKETILARFVGCLIPLVPFPGLSGRGGYCSNRSIRSSAVRGPLVLLVLLVLLS
jgi:hypothetical protein